MKILAMFLVLSWSQYLFSSEEGCSSWPINMAFVHLKNKGLIDSNLIEHEKTKASLLKIEKLEDDLYRQMYRIEYVNKSDVVIEVITINDASSEECSMSDVDVYVRLQKK
jgi:hypothetical protein